MEIYLLSIECNTTARIIYWCNQLVAIVSMEATLMCSA